jgi:hypothetical protein
MCLSPVDKGFSSIFGMLWGETGVPESIQGSSNGGGSELMWSYEKVHRCSLPKGGLEDS